jgi:osmotically-inducible protein OsmY
MITPLLPPVEGGRATPEPVEIRQVAERRLLGARYTALSDVHCAFEDGVLCLRGQLPTYHLKQIALALVADLEGVRSISNQIQVVVPAVNIRPWGISVS